MNDHGYTLVEMLVALVMVGLATGGLSLAARHVAETERRVRGQHDIVLQLDRLRNAARPKLASGGPFTGRAASTAVLEGDASQLHFSCDAKPCGLTLSGPLHRQTASFAEASGHRDFPLYGLGTLGWRYLSAQDGRQTQEWPPSDREDRLAAIVLVNGQSPIMVLRTPVQQSSACMFDVASHDCVAVAGP
jgi:prepilin-type N-terminal cleavage/methylation domain-containing protein